MRAIDCSCGYLVHADDDDGLVAALRAHQQETHPDTVQSDEEIQARVAGNAYDAPTGDPPWAY